MFLFGEYRARLDGKRRFGMPSALLALLPEGARTDFVLQRASDPCLWLYPLPIWRAELEALYRRINPFSPEERNFLRLYQAGAQPVSLDSDARLLLPKPLCDYAGIQTDIVLLGMKDRIEIWAEPQYTAWKAENETNLTAWMQKFLGQSLQ
ncbi:MAG: division/cell wall cluster transcriptional repressor MraZ [Bacteroidia bacterium]|nr:division/cell wall cluster transcriptional repressor MraZ [Bacteroidia bacterium]